MEYHLSEHAQQRAQRRAIRPECLAPILCNFDIDFDIGGGCRLLRLSRSAAREVANNLGMPSQAKRFSAIAIIENEVTGQIVTVMHDRGTTEGRRYRRMH